MVESGSLKLELVSNVSQTASARNLSRHHDHKLAPAVQASVLTPRLEAILLDFAKIMSVKKVKQLMEDCVRMCPISFRVSGLAVTAL